MVCYFPSLIGEDVSIQVGGTSGDELLAVSMEGTVNHLNCLYRQRHGTRKIVSLGAGLPNYNDLNFNGSGETITN